MTVLSWSAQSESLSDRISTKGSIRSEMLMIHSKALRIVDPTFPRQASRQDQRENVDRPDTMENESGVGFQSRPKDPELLVCP